VISAKQTQVTTIELLRHGQCEGGEIFRGSTDVLLTDHGWQQMLDSVKGNTYDRVVSSPMQRCKHFSSALAEQSELPLTVQPGLEEIHFGDWEGHSRDAIEREHGDIVQQFWRDPLTISPPNGEATLDFQRRVTRAFSAVTEKALGERVLIVTHGAVIRVIMCHLLDIPLSSMSNISVPYAGRTTFAIYHHEDNEPWVQLIAHQG